MLERLITDTCIQGTPPFRDTKFARGKTSTKSLYLLPLLMGHLYSWEMDTTSGSQNPGLTSVQEISWY